MKQADTQLWNNDKDVEEDVSPRTLHARERSQMSKKWFSLSFVALWHQILGTPDKICDFIHDSTESRVIGTPISRICVTRKHRPCDAKPTSQSVYDFGSDGNKDQSQTYKPTKVSPLQQATSKRSASSRGPNSSTTNPAKKPRQSPREPLCAHIPNVLHTPGPEEGEDHEDDMVVHHAYYRRDELQLVVARGIRVRDVSLWNIDPKKHSPKDKADLSAEFQNVIKEEGLWSKEVSHYIFFLEFTNNIIICFANAVGLGDADNFVFDMRLVIFTVPLAD
jgi:hypothetical protein